MREALYNRHIAFSCADGGVWSEPVQPLIGRLMLTLNKADNKKNSHEKNDKKQIVLGLEPTGHYWFALAAWMISNGISVVQVNPYAVKQSKEIEDNSQLKQ